ncbi:GOR [Symbiodinium natans]|uniref:GOR protein n=1 Tax=Symbiodinium natans TaxID=878477 RepID=A0A812S8Q4_9DINO|nr:GOR [Symbiodinium natans]
MIFKVVLGSDSYTCCLSGYRLKGDPSALPVVLPFQVRTELKRGTCFFITPDATKKRFQTTIHAAAKSQEVFGKIDTRSCATREEVEQFKQECYKRLGGGFVRSGSGIPSVESKQPAAKKRPKPSEGEAVLQRLQEQGKLDGAIQVSGRDSSKKNSTVNGIYVRVEGGYNGQPAFERIKIGGDDAKRCLYYAKDRSRWKLGEEQIVRA